MCALGDLDKARQRANVIAWTYYLRGDVDAAASWTDRSISAGERLGGEYDHAMEEHLRGLIATERKEYDVAEPLLQNVSAAYRSLGMVQAAAVTLSNLGNLEYDRRNYVTAEKHFSDALALTEGLGSKEGMAYLHWCLGRLAFKRKNLSEAEEHLKRGLSLAREIGRLDFIANAEFVLALMYEEEGQPEAALPLAQAAVAMGAKLRHQNLPTMQKLLDRLMKKTNEQ
jgi:tetratricopeptide (TPR) repeat protein